MKKFVATILLCSATAAFASEASGRHDNSGILVWAFLGFCALIIAAQVVPSVLVMFGISKALFGKPLTMRREEPVKADLDSEA